MILDLAARHKLRATDERQGHLAGQVESIPGLRLEVEGIFTAEGVGHAADEGDGVGASCSQPGSLLYQLGRASVVTNKRLSHLAIVA